MQLRTCRRLVDDKHRLESVQDMHVLELRADVGVRVLDQHARGKCGVTPDLGVLIGERSKRDLEDRLSRERRVTMSTLVLRETYTQRIT